MKTIIILGGGIGGITAANELSDQFSEDIKIILIEKNKDHTFAPSFLWLMTGGRTRNEINVPLKSLLKNNVELVNASVDLITPTDQVVKAGQVEFHYDFLIIALGADLVPEKIPGWDESIHTFYYHYLPPDKDSVIHYDLFNKVSGLFTNKELSLEPGMSWTTDAPYRETPAAIENAKNMGAIAVEMEASALYAFALTKNKNIICFAHLTNSMAQNEIDFEKGIENGSLDSLNLVYSTIKQLEYI